MYNYHSHTTRCKHAKGTEEEYIQAALGSGFGLLGFSDHTPWPYENGFVGTYHMEVSQFAGYRDTILELKEKYKGKIEIRLGMECEYFPAYISWLKELKEKEPIDYLILGNHFHTTDDGGVYQGNLTDAASLREGCDMLIRGMGSGLYMYVAHPDLLLRSYPRFDEEAKAVSREVCRAAVSMDIPLEYNLLGVLYSKRGLHAGLGYPCKAFWEVAAQEGVTAVIGVDAHEPDHLRNVDVWQEAYDFITLLGMTTMTRRV